MNELENRRNAFEKQRDDLIKTVQLAGDSLQKIEALKKGVPLCFGISAVHGRILPATSGHPRLETILRNLDRFLAQARYDPSVSPQTLDRWQQIMLRQLEVQALKFEYASLYGQLTKEWLSVTQKRESSDKDSDVDMSGFEHVSTGKSLESRIDWE
ncbi:MAG: hypothetical protein L6R37_006985 [Teloschistes peruensis]|nr:MAG: hypothetical protein L6R37_006985 [Teloschistes peruensis]